MEKLEQQLEEIRSLIKGLKLATPPKMPALASTKNVGMPSPVAPVVPAIPTLTPNSKKNPIDVAQQVKNPGVKKLAVKQAKEFMKTDSNGQWKLESV